VLIGVLAGVVVLTLVVGGVVLVATRGGDKPPAPAAAGTAPATTGASPAAPSGARFDVPIGPDGNGDPKDWPDACELLTDAELRALVPQAGTITRKGGAAGPSAAPSRPTTWSAGTSWPCRTTPLPTCAPSSR
jgi:hypothetical protein